MTVLACCQPGVPATEGPFSDAGCGNGVDNDLIEPYAGMAEYSNVVLGHLRGKSWNSALAARRFILVLI